MQNNKTKIAKPLLPLIFLPLILIFFLYGHFFDKKQVLNSLWKDSMKSPQGTITIKSSTQEGSFESVNVLELQYETRADGFWYQQSQYTENEAGNFELESVTEVSENGKKVKIDHMPEYTQPNMEIYDLGMLVNGLWENLTASNVEHIEEEIQNSQKKYIIEYSVRDHSDFIDSHPELVTEVYTKRKRTLFVDKDTHKLSSLIYEAEGHKTNNEKTPVCIRIKADFR